MTEAWLRKCALKPAKLILYSGNVFTKDAFATFKAEAIDQNMVSTYYENDRGIIELLKMKLKGKRVTLKTERKVP